MFFTIIEIYKIFIQQLYISYKKIYKFIFIIESWSL